MKLTVVIIAFNEEGNVKPLIESIVKTCHGMDYEVVAIDDGSLDGTAQELKSCREEFDKLQVFTLKRNFGQTAAIAAGFDHAKGDIVIPLDGDGQNDPRDIPVLLKEIEKGFDVVSGWRKNRRDSWFFRRLPSRMANALISWVSGVRLHDYGCTIKAYRRNIINNLQISGEMHRFLPAWCVWQGGKVTEVIVNHRPRTRGASKYGMMRVFKVVIDLITLKFFSGYLSKPSYLFSGSGFVLLGLSGLSVAAAFFDKLGPNRHPELRYPLLLLGVFFGLMAISFIMIGLLAELLVRLYFQVRQQKPYRLADE